MGKINVFEPHIGKDFDVFFQKDATLETKIDVRYLKYSAEEIDKYVNQEVKPELAEYVANEKNKLISYHLDLDNNVLSLAGTDVTTSAVDLGELSFDDKYVTLIGRQNIDDVKTFTENPVISKNEAPALEVQNTSTMFGSTPTEDQVASVCFVDATGTTLGSVQHKVYADTQVVSCLECSNLEASESSEIAIGYDENGNVFTSAPTPAIGDNSTKIATTAFVEQIKQNLQDEIDLKEDIVSDLPTIRSGAALGATAVQPASLATVATSGSYNDLSNKPTIPAAQVNTDWNASSGVAQILNKPSLATVATSGNYNDLLNKPKIPTVNNATLTIQKNGTTVKTFTANASSNVTANITVPTKVSELTNDSGYITGISTSDVTNALGYIPENSASLATVATSGSYNDLSNKPTIPTVNNATLTIQKNGTTVKTFTANASSNVTANITVPTKVSELTNDSGYTSNAGTITGINMNGASKGTSGVVDLGTVATSDTKNTAGSTNTSSKIFLIGATSQAANPQTYSHDTVFVNTLGQLVSATPADSTNSTVVATTAFVKSVLSASGSGLAEILKAENGYCKFSNGLIIQWGRVTGLGNENTGKFVTLPTAFTSTNYRVAITGRYSSRTINTSQALDTGTDYTTTAFKFFSSYCSAIDWLAIGY